MFDELFHIEKIYDFCQKICYFLVVNLISLFLNLPLLLFFLFVGISQVRNYLPLFLVCMLPIAPAISAVFYTMNRMMRGIETRPLKDYMKGYKTDFWQKFRLGAIQLFAIFVLWTNIEFFSKQVIIIPLVIIFTILFAFCIIITPNLYLLASRYEMNNIAIIKDACILTITRPICTLGTIATLGITLMFIEISAGTAVLFMISIYGFLVVFISRNIMRDLEKSQ